MTMKLTLISPLPEIICFGIRSIAAYLELQGFETQLIFLPDPKENENTDEKYRYSDTFLDSVVQLCHGSDLIGVSLYSNNLENAIQITGRIKKEFNVPVIWGGKHPSAMPEMSLEYADIVAIGESEIPMAELLRKMEQGENYHNVKGFWFKHNGKIIKNPVGELVENLVEIPILEYVSDSHYVWDKNKNRLLSMDESVLERFRKDNPFITGKVYHIMTSRGCPFSCSYCYTYKNLYKGKKYVRRRSVENVIEELSRVKRRYSSINLISISDDEFLSAGLEYIRKFCELYKQQVNLPFHCLFHPAMVTEKKLECLVDAGLSVIQMGIQTGSKRTKKLYHRHVTNEKTLQSIRLINQYKHSILASYDFIIDNPYEQQQDLVDTIRFIAQFSEPYTLNIFSLVFFPGTRLFDKAVEDKLINPSKIDAYSKKYHRYDRRYLNLIFHTLKYHIPQPLIKFLISKPVVFVLDRPLFTLLFSSMVRLWKMFKRLIGMKKPTGGFELGKRLREVHD